MSQYASFVVDLMKTVIQYHQHFPRFIPHVMVSLLARRKLTEWWGKSLQRQMRLEIVDGLVEIVGLEISISSMTVPRTQCEAFDGVWL